MDSAFISKLLVVFDGFLDNGLVSTSTFFPQSVLATCDTSMLFTLRRPVTNNLGFLDARFDRTVTFASRWLAPQGYDEPILFDSSIEHALDRLFPMSSRRILLIECQFGWTSLFKDLDDVPEGPIGHLSQLMKCRGVIGTHDPSEIKDIADATDSTKHWGAVQFRFFEGHETEFLNYGRCISVSNDEGRWRFDDGGGPPFDFEQTDAYQARRIKERFTVKMLIDYLSHLGIDVDDSSRFGPRCALFDVPRSIDLQRG